MNNPFYNHNIFPEICKYMNLKELIKLEQLSKYHRDLIRNYPWDHLIVRLRNKTLYILKIYKFMKWNLSSTNVTDEDVKELKNCHVLWLQWTNVTDESIKELGKCNTLNLYATKITDKSVKELKNCHTLILPIHVTDESVKELKECRVLDLSYCCQITDKSVKELKNCYVLDLSHCKKITNESIKELRNCRKINLYNTSISDECKNELKENGVEINTFCWYFYG